MQENNTHCKLLNVFEEIQAKHEQANKRKTAYTKNIKEKIELIKIIVLELNESEAMLIQTLRQCEKEMTPRFYRAACRQKEALASFKELSLK